MKKKTLITIGIIGASVGVGAIIGKIAFDAYKKFKELKELDELLDEDAASDEGELVDEETEDIFDEE